MSFTFETSGNNTFLVYAIQEEDVLDTMTLGMITNNRIPGLAAVLYTQMNRDCFLKYNVTAKVTVKQFFSGVVNRRRLLGVFSSVAVALTAAQEYMIDDNSLLLDTEHMYADVSNCSAEVICLPVVREAENVDRGMFFKNIMFSTQFDQTENCDYVTRIINYLNSMPVFVAEDFLRILEELQEINIPTQPRQTVMMSKANDMAQSQQPASIPQTSASAQFWQPDAVSRKQGSSGGSGIVFAVPGQDGDGGFAVPEQDGDSGVAMPGQSSESGAAEADGQVMSRKWQKKVQKEIKKQFAPRQSASEKEMSMLYLLQHYNKENVAVYKAQKEAKKKGGKEALAASPMSTSASEFAVPGQQVKPQFQQPGGQLIPAQSQPRSDVRRSERECPSAQPQPSVQSFLSDDDFGETVVMGADGCGEDTVVIGEVMIASAIQPYLRRSSNNEKILLDKPIFRIGKERSYVDYCISGNSTISRSHADIIDRDGHFFIVDNNSTNHTYIDGEMIPSNTEIPLAHGTKIRLSNEDFEFLTL